MQQEKFSLLVVEDNPDDVILLRAMLAEEASTHFEIEVANSLERALAALQKGLFDAALLDLNLPDSQGLETFHALRAASRRLPIIVVTVLDLEDVAFEAVSFGAQDYLVKDQLTGPLVTKAVRYGIQRMRTRAKLEKAKEQLQEQVDEQVSVIRANEERYRAMFQHMGSAVVVYEAVDGGNDFIIKEFNPAAEGIERLSRADVIGRQVTEVFPNVREFGLLAVLQRVWESGTAHIHPATFYSDERIEGWRKNSVYKLPTGEIVAIYEDVTEEKIAEETIADLARFPEENPEPVLRIDGDATILYANSSSRGLLQLIGAEVGQKLPDDLASISCKILENNQTKTTEYCRDDKTFALTFSPMRERNYVNLYVSDISERSRAEREVHHQLNTTIALSRLYPPLISTSDLGEISNIVNEEAKTLTQSEHGYVGSIDEEGNLIVHSLSIMLEDGCEVQGEEHRNTKFMPDSEGVFHSLYGHSLNSFEAFFINEPSKHPSSTGVPKGHIPIQRFLSVPVMLGEELVGQIALSNKPDAYTESDLSAVQRLAEYYALAIKKERDDRFLNQLYSAVEQSPATVIITDLTGAIKYVNPKFSDLTGYSREEVIGVNPRILKSGLQGPEFYKQLWETLAQGDVWQGELCNKTKDGMVFWEYASISPIRDEQGNVTHYLGVKEDITRRKLAEEQLRESEGRYRTLYESMHDGFFSADMSGRFTDANPAFLNMIGYDKASLLEMKIEDITPSESVQIEQRLMQEQIIPRGYSELYDKEFICKDGGTFSASLRTHLIRKEDGTPSGGWAVVRDVTERRQAEDLAKEYTQLLHTVLEGIEAAILIVDMEKHIVVEANSVAQALLTDGDDLLGKSCRSILSVENDQHPCSVLTKPIINQETVLMRQDGTRVPVLRSILPVRLRGKKHIVETLFDLSERRKLEAQLLQAQKLESIGQLAAGIAHEINTPAQYVDNNLRYLQDGFKDVLTVLDACSTLAESARSQGMLTDDLSRNDEVKKSLGIEHLLEEIPLALNESIEGLLRIAEIVRSVKQFSHPGEAHKEMVDINEAIRSTMVVSRNEWKYDSELETSLDDSLPTVPCFLSEFNQVLLNLIINATHSIQERREKGDDRQGRIVITTKRDGDWLVISVSDNGTGIAKEHHDKLFDPFFTTKKVGRGTGQGLAISHSIIFEKHGGQLYFETEAGQGSTFFIKLPIMGKDEGDH